MNFRIRPLLALSALLPALLPAQSPELTQVTQHTASAAGALLPEVTPIHSSAADPDGDYGTWAAGRDYKVSFTGDMTFVPYLGRDYPHNQPWTWRTIGATSGSVALPIEQAGSTHGERTFRYQRGAVVEAYEVRPEGLEQTFVIARRPQTPGAIVVTGAIVTNLRAEPFEPVHTAVTFVDAAGDAIVSYGESVAFDNRGQRVDVLTSFDGKHLSLTVPAAFVEVAEFPLTIDPIISTTQVVFAVHGGQLTAVDVVRDDSFDRVTCCHSRWASSQDADCWATEWDDQLAAGSDIVLFADLQTSWSSDEIAGAVADWPHRYCFVVRREFANDTSRVRYHVHDAGDPVVSAIVRGIGGPSGSIDWRVDVGGTNRSSFGDAFVLVWQRDLATSNTADSRIHAAIVDVQTELATSVSVPPASITVTVDCEFPVVNQVEQVIGNAPLAWAICWQESVAGGAWGASIRKIEDTAAVSSTFLRFASGAQHLRPQIAGSQGRYAVAYGASSSSQLAGATDRESGHGLEVRRFDWPHGGAPVAQAPERLKERVQAVHSQWQPTSIAFDYETASHWLVTYISDSQWSGSGSGFAARVGYGGGLLEEDVLLHYNDPAQNWKGATLGGAFYDDDAGEFLAITAIAWTPVGGAKAHRIGHAPVVAASQTGTGCSPVGLSWVGFGDRQQIGCEFSRVRVSNAPANTLHMLMVSFGSQDTILQHPLVEPGCSLNVDIVSNAYLGTMPLAVGSAVEWQLPLPEWLDPSTLYFQDWHFNTSGSLLQSSRRLEVPIAK